MEFGRGLGRENVLAHARGAEPAAAPLDSEPVAWRHGVPISGPMPLFLLRDGAIRRCAVVPDGLAFTTYTDRHKRRIHVVLDPESERLLLRAQPRRQTRRPGAATGAGRRRAEPPLAA